MFNLLELEGLEGQMVMSPPPTQHGCWGPNPSPLQEQSVFLTPGHLSSLPLSALLSVFNFLTLPPATVTFPECQTLTRNCKLKELLFSTATESKLGQSPRRETISLWEEL